MNRQKINDKGFDTLSYIWKMFLMTLIAIIAGLVFLHVLQKTINNVNHEMIKREHVNERS